MLLSAIEKAGSLEGAAIRDALKNIHIAGVTGKISFDENRNLFGDPRTEPEKFNLYNGLASMAEAVSELQMQVQSLSQEVQMLRQELRTR